MEMNCKNGPIKIGHAIETDPDFRSKQKGEHIQCILTLTRSCTQDCDFCAVDALYNPSITACADRALAEQLAGRELLPDQWCSVVERLLAMDPFAEFDLSGGDCLALPWVPNQLIPFILERVQTCKQVSITSTAEALQSWFNKTRLTCPEKMPGSVHVTFDGYRPYSFENIRLASQVREFGMEIHVECPLTAENCDLDKIREIYYMVKDAKVRELLLMRFFPVGRAARESGISEFEPPADAYRAAIAEFNRLEGMHTDGPTIKVQCALRKFEPKGTGATPCKMGTTTWCVMPNGTLLICPWAYSINGRPLDEVFVAGNILQRDYEEINTRALRLRKILHGKYPRDCRIRAFVQESREETKASLKTGIC